jgi:hypothetical protein
MKYSLLKSIGAMLAGIIAGAIPAVAMDSILEKAGIMETDPFDANPTGLIMGVLLYRLIFNVTGSYVTARLAPKHPMRHAMILGILGLVIGTIGTIVMWDVPPHWYSIGVALISVPCAWTGAKLAEIKFKSSTHH